MKTGKLKRKRERKKGKKKTKRGKRICVRKKIKLEGYKEHKGRARF